MFIDHLVVCITVMISAVVWPIVCNTSRICTFLLTSDGFLNHFPIKALVIY